MTDQSASRNWLPFNINHAVRVKLTQRGLDVLKAKHDALYEWSQSVKGPLRPWEPPTLKDGWYETPLWCLMNDFGDETRMGLDPCFETTIELTAPVSERPHRTDTNAEKAAALLVQWIDESKDAMPNEETLNDAVMFARLALKESNERPE